MKIDIYKDPSEFELRLYVACHTDDQESAKKIEGLLNTKLNHIGAREQLPERENWTVKAFCQVHLKDDSDVSNDDPGPGSVIDVFTKILKYLHEQEEFNVTIDAHVQEVLNESDVKIWAEGQFTQINPQLVGIDKLAKILHETDLNDVGAVLKKLEPSSSSLPYLIGGVGLIACFAMGIYRLRANHLARVNNPVKLVG